MINDVTEKWMAAFFNKLYGKKLVGLGFDTGRRFFSRDFIL